MVTKREKYRLLSHSWKRNLHYHMAPFPISLCGRRPVLWRAKTWLVGTNTTYHMMERIEGEKRAVEQTKPDREPIQENNSLVFH